jgi:hypothetical protein
MQVGASASPTANIFWGVFFEILFLGSYIEALQNSWFGNHLLSWGSYDRSGDKFSEPINQTN